MKIRIIFIPCLILLLAASGRSQQAVYIQGQVTANETGLPVAQKAVSIGFYPAQPITTEYTNTEGHYAAQITVQPIDSASLLYISVIECNQQPVSQTFSILNQNQIQTDFEICTIFGNCQASFNYRPDSINQQLIIFENFSGPMTNTTNWSWDFGDGSFAGEFNPVHEFAAPGIYNVCLTMTDSVNLCSNVFCMEVWVNNISGDCAALFDWNAQGLSVAFTDLSIGFPDSYFWDFGDGTSSSEPNPVHAWQQPGNYEVCLSIFNDSTQCQDTYCNFITVGDTLPGCQAYYTYQQVVGNTYAFTNQSTGMIDQLLWDFGDGTTSQESNPVHTWQQTGIYRVYLIVISNIFGCQDAFWQDITIGDTITVCHAAFTFKVDSIPGNINHYRFTDTSTGNNISTWYWDFGDGSESFLQSPEYTFAGNGTYTVCHAIGGQGNGGYCADTICTTITTPVYNNLGGQVFAGTFPINNPSNTGDTAIVKLYRKTGNLLSEVASGFFYEFGYYYFLNVMEGNYLVHASLTPASNATQLYLPGYNGEAQHWQLAQPLSLAGSDIFDANIIMPDPGQQDSGPGMISGSLHCIDNSVIELKDRIVFLSHGGNIVAYTYTHENGAFWFSGLQLSDYSLTAEIAGKYSQTIGVNLTELEIQVSGIRIQVASSGVYSIGDEPGSSQIAAISIYPNPAREELTITINAATTGLFDFRVFSVTGSQLIEFSASLLRGENVFTTNISFLNSGLYLLSVESGEGIPAGKIRFIKQ